MDETDLAGPFGDEGDDVAVPDAGHDERDQVAVVGLGGIGGGVGARLADRGRPVVGVDLDPMRAQAWQEQAGRPAHHALAGVDWTSVRVLLIAVRTQPQVDAVLAHDGVRTALAGGASAVLLTTLTPTQARAIADSHAQSRILELPVSGGEVRARRGELTGLIAGPPTDSFEDALLADLFTSLFRLDAIGHPSLLKLLNNTLAARHAWGTAVALRVAHEHGVDAATAAGVIAASSGASVAGAALAVLSENQVELLAKDARLLVDELGRSPFETASPDDITSTVGAAQRLLPDTEEGTAS